VPELEHEHHGASANARVIAVMLVLLGVTIVDFQVVCPARKVAIIAFMAGLFAFSGAAQAGGSEEMTPREALLAGVQAAKARLSDRVEMTISAESVITRKPGVRRYVRVYKRSGDRFAIWTYPDEEALEKGLHTSRKICDGESLLFCRACVDAYTDKGKATLDPARDGIDPFGSHQALSLAGWIENDDSPERALLSENCTVSAEPVEIEGVAAYEVAYERTIDEDRSKITYWIAPGLSCMPVAMEQYVNGKLRKRVDFADFKEVAPGFWVPTTRERTCFRRGGALREHNVYNVIGLDVSAHINELLFEIDLASIPEGYIFADNIRGVSYVIGQGPVSDHAVEKVVSHIDAEFPGLLEDLAAGTPERLDDAALAESEPEAAGVSPVDERPAPTAAPGAPESRSPWIAILGGAAVIAAAFLLLLLARRNGTARKAKP